MTEWAVRADRLSKSYRIGEYHSGYKTLRDSIAAVAARAVRRREARAHHDELWALRDVSFDVAPGEVVGFIGPNGAGKSTLLKVLTRITAPTSGIAEIRGRIGSILEVGTGFHPELTGRENIYLNGSILGMRRREIRAKLPHIVEFSGVDQLIDTPVKRYSSGMYVRLAFAVAAHLDPEVLIVDEVLAVGDHEFQQRCLGRMQDLSRSGRTVLFVSHDMQAVSRLCHRAYFLRQGKIVVGGPSDEVVAQYLHAVTGVGSAHRWPDLATAPGDDLVRLRSARVVDTSGETISSVDVRSAVGIELGFTVVRHGEPVLPKIKLNDHRGQIIFNAIDTDPRWDEPSPPGDYRSTVWIPGNLLNEGFVSVDIGLGSLAARGPKLSSHVEARGAVTFHVRDPGEGDSAKGRFAGQLRGAVRPLLAWTCEHD